MLQFLKCSVVSVKNLLVWFAPFLNNCAGRYLSLIFFAQQV